MNDVKMDLDDAMRMLVALHEEHMGIHEQLDALGVPHVAKRDGQWRLALLTSRLEMAERNLVQERDRREHAERNGNDVTWAMEVDGLRAERDDLKKALCAERAAHEATRKRLTEDQALLTECRRQRDAAMTARDEAKRKFEERVEDGRWVVAAGRSPADSEYHVYDNETFARSGYARLLQAGVRPYLCRVIEGPGGWDGSGKKDPEKATEVSAPTDVDELLREAEKVSSHVPQSLMARIAAALRAQRSRGDILRGAHHLADERAHTAAVHLRHVIAWQWPTGTKPKPVREAEAFLAGVHPLAQDEAETHMRAEVQRLRGELEAEKTRHDKMSREWAADAQQREVNLVRALKAEQVVDVEKAKREAVDRILEDIGATLDASGAPPGLMAERVEWLAKKQTPFEPSEDAVARLMICIGEEIRRGTYGSDVPTSAVKAAASAVLVKVAEMVPSEEDIAKASHDVYERSYAMQSGNMPKAWDDETDIRKRDELAAGRAVRSLILSRLGLTGAGVTVESAQSQPLDGLDVWLAEAERRCPTSTLPNLATTEPIYWHSDRLAATLARELRRVMAGPWLVVWKGIDGAINVTSQTTDRAARRAFDMSSGMALCRVVETKEGAM